MVYLLLAVVGAIRVAIAVTHSETFGAEATIALGLLVLGLAGALGAIKR